MLRAADLRCEYKINPMGIGERNPRFSWIIESDDNGIQQTAYHLQVALDEAFTDILWDSGAVGSSHSIHVAYAGPALNSRTRYYFRVKVSDNKSNESVWSDAAFFETGLLNASEWVGEFIAGAYFDHAHEAPGTLVRKSFKTRTGITSARLYATSLGLYELSLNGKRVGDALLTPGWTSYTKRLQYQTYDVTDLLVEGDNALGANLGSGWFHGEIGYVGKRKIYGDKTALLAQLHIKYSDGSEQVIITDGSWKTGKSPILASEFYLGECYDARLETEDWDKPEFNDSSWPSVEKITWNKSLVVAQENVPVRRISEITPIAIFSTPSGETVLDMGQNMVGWVRFRVTGEAGDKVILRHAEILDSKGNFYTENLRTAQQLIEYTLKGKGVECFEPHFTFQGFRYVKIEAYPGTPQISDFTGIVIHSDMEPTGEFSCSNEMINQLQHNILWGLKGNFVDVPTDCPQRNERLGWTGDAQVFARTACFLMNTAPFFKKWLRDLAVDQLPNGGVPYVIPNMMEESKHSSAGWGDAAVICPWTVYLSYGDTGILEAQYESMKGWIEYIRSKAQDGVIWNSGFHFGDWVALDAKEGSYFGATANDLIATAYYAYSTELFVKAARILARKTGNPGYKQDAELYDKLHQDIVTAFRKEFYTPNGRLAVPTQTGHVLALMFNLVDEKDRARTVNDLVALIEAANWHLTTGFLGTPYLCHVLSSNGRADIAFKLLMQTDYPSWLYPITKGATTIWEHWDGLKPDGSLWSADMNSFNHYAYGAIGDWMYRVVAGIDTDEIDAGYKKILLKPLPGGGLTFAKASLKSMYGRISCGWQLDGDRITIEVDIPCNTTAELTLPRSRMANLRNEIVLNGSHQAVDTPQGVKISLESGSYTFTYRLCD